MSQIQVIKTQEVLGKDFKRQFNIETYKALKRNEVDKAIKIIECYKAPLYLLEKIQQKNEEVEQVEYIN